MKHLSLFSGIGGFDLAAERAGFENDGHSEVDKSACQILAKRFPKVKNHGDIREIKPRRLDRPKLVTGGFPCQDISLAGKREGLAGARSGLFHEAIRIVRGVRPVWVVLENVGGLLSSGPTPGEDLRTVLDELGHGWGCRSLAFRVLDSQHFGVPQRRRRVFIVGSSRKGGAEAVLSLAEGGGRDPTSVGREGRRVAKPFEGGPANPLRAGGAIADVGGDAGNVVIEESRGRPTTTISERLGNGVDVDATQTFVIEENQRAEVRDLGDKTSALHGPGGRMQPLVVDWFGRDVTPTLRANERNASYPSAEPLVIHPTIMARQNDGGGFNEAKSVAATGMIRRLTPMECEKLQAFPPGWTCLETEFDEDGVGRFAGGTPYLTAACKCPDGPRYKVLGNAITVNVGYWILDRIAKFEHGTLKPPPKP